MNKKLLILFSFICFTASATSYKLESDTLTFEMQRKRVNDLLDQRSAKFSEYDYSLEQKTGFFGLLKSHDDMQYSLNILEDIIRNDNHIFIETRKLLNLKDGERERFQALAMEYDAQITAHMKTVSKLQKENEKLREKIQSLEISAHKNHMIAYVLILLVSIGLVGYSLYYRHSKNKM